MVNEEEIVEVYEQTFDEGYDCEDCEYKKLIHEPHGEVTRHCSMEHYIQECPVIEFLMTGEPPAYDEYKERRAGFFDDDQGIDDNVQDKMIRPSVSWKFF